MTSHLMHYLNIFQVRQLHFSAMHLRLQINLSIIATRNILFSAISCISAPYAVGTLNIRELAHYERDVISALISERNKTIGDNTFGNSQQSNSLNIVFITVFCEINIFISL